MKSLVSVIVPFYNTDDFIESNIESIINQTYKNIEIIYVNDGSTDNSENIVKKFNNILLLNTPKTNAGDSRNYGLKYAHGEYVFFFDSDDLIDFKCVELCVEQMDNNYDCVLYSTNVIPPYYKTPNEMMNITNVVWNKCFRMSLIKKYNIWFSNINNSNDLSFTHAYLTLCKNYIVIPYKLYNKRCNPSSIMTKNYLEPNCVINALKDLSVILKNNNIFKSNEIIFKEYYLKQCEYMEKILNKKCINIQEFLNSKFTTLDEILK